MDAEQLAQRKHYLGGSDAAAALGMSRWKSVLQLWAEKTGRISAVDSDSEAKLLGRELEDYVARRFSRLTGKKVQRVNETMFSRQYPYLAANIDRRIVGERAGLECKTASVWRYREWEGQEIPAEYILQCYHYLAVTEWDRWYIACLIGNQKFVWKEIERDEKIISDIVSKERKFWDEFVSTNVMPISISASDSDILFQLYPEAIQREQIQLGDDVDALVESLDSLEADKRVLEREILQQKNVIKTKLGEYEQGVTSRYRISWKNQSTRRLNIDMLRDELPEIYERYSRATRSRVLNIYDKEERDG
jgi:putative phage-type endonuclease